ncbi:hypothetical protein [Bacillus marasmi]|uniref:hypothetical protein n=1 Tax=Bacillus marasmi TaxID=1926279 RepID=UPI0011C94A21|nr:hypothetical protein [Bacillus marasmi]
MSEIKLKSPEDMRKLSDVGIEFYKQSVLSGDTLKNIVKQIEKAALEGYSGWQQTITAASDLRELKVIRDYFVSKGFYCDFETETHKSLVGWYKVEKFVVDWKEKK